MGVLSAQALEKLKKFLERDARHYGTDEPGSPDPHSLILAWAGDPEHGALPAPNASAFANWLSNGWADRTEESSTVDEVLNRAVTDWCGGRTF